MHKAIAVLFVVALAAVIVLFAVLLRREPDVALAGPVGVLKKGSSPEAAAESAQLRAELEKLRKENEATRRRAEEAEARVAALEAGSTSTTADPKKAAVKKGDWKTRRDPELEAKVKAMAWGRSVKGLIEYWKEVEEARKEGRSVQYTPELVGPLTALQADVKELAKYLGLEGESDFRVFQNDVVNGAWMDAFLQEVTGGSVSEDQFTRLRETSLYQSDPDWVFDSSGNFLETWKFQVEQNWAFGRDTAGILTPEQNSVLARTVTPTYLMSTWAYGERAITGTAAVSDYWMKSFKLPEDQRAAVEAAAAEFVRRQTEIASQYAGARTRDMEFEILIKTMEAQIAAEKLLAQTLQVDPELAKKLLKGSGAVLKISQ